LYDRIKAAKRSVIPLAIMIGHSDFNIPKTNHVATPNVKTEYIVSDIAEVSFVFNTFMACGTNAKVVEAAAT